MKYVESLPASLVLYALNDSLRVAARTRSDGNEKIKHFSPVYGEWLANNRPRRMSPADLDSTAIVFEMQLTSSSSSLGPTLKL